MAAGGRKIIQPLLFIDVDAWAYDQNKTIRSTTQTLMRKQEGRFMFIGMIWRGDYAKGLYTNEDLHKEMAYLKDYFHLVVPCLHHPEAPSEEFRRCFCRKPETGMLAMAQVILPRQFDKVFIPSKMIVWGGDPTDSEWAKNIECTGTTYVHLRKQLDAALEL